jgi:hypothetical protein
MQVQQFALMFINRNYKMTFFNSIKSIFTSRSRAQTRKELERYVTMEYKTEDRASVLRSLLREANL